RWPKALRHSRRAGTRSPRPHGRFRRHGELTRLLQQGEEGDRLDGIPRVVEARILEHADDLVRLRLVSVAEPEAMTDGSRAGEIATRERLVHHRDERRAGAVFWPDGPAR